MTSKSTCLRTVMAIVTVAVMAVTVSCVPTEIFLREAMPVKNRDVSVVRVLLKKSDGKITIESRLAFKVVDKISGRLMTDLNSRRITLTTDTVHTALIAESGDAPVSLNGKEYRGYLEITPRAGQLWVVNVVRLDEYLYSVVPAEILPSWPAEAIKAQAVAARTYTHRLLKRAKQDDLYDLEANNSFQMYEGILKEHKATTDAVRVTGGYIMKFSNEPIMAYYHSTCGGSTCDDRNVWKGEDLKYLESRTCKFCKDSPKFTWESVLTIQEIGRAIAKKHPGIKRIKGITFRRDGKRVTDVLVAHSAGNLRISGNDFRLLFPQEKMRSLYFTSKISARQIHFKGYGWGHGVGMCQWGARGMAVKGLSYKQILHYYYKNVSIAPSSSLPVVTKR